LAVRLRPLKPARLAHLLAGVAGFLLASAFLDLVPHVAEEQGAQWLPFVLVGYLFVFAAESLFPAHAHPEELGPGTKGAGWSGSLAGGGPVSFLAALFGLSVHAFFDGIALMGGFAAGFSSGLLVLLAVTLHKVPVGFSLGALGRETLRRRRLAAWSGGVLALATLAGAAATLAVGRAVAAAEPALLPLAAGALIYIGATDMIPATHHDAGRTQGVAAVAGAILFYLSVLAVRALGLE
ncbi:MAG TPA: ZIP family metal transporter, partial [Limnochorda sp.]